MAASVDMSKLGDSPCTSRASAHLRLVQLVHRRRTAAVTGVAHEAVPTAWRTCGTPLIAAAREFLFSCSDPLRSPARGPRPRRWPAGVSRHTRPPFWSPPRVTVSARDRLATSLQCLRAAPSGTVTPPVTPRYTGRGAVTPSCPPVRLLRSDGSRPCREKNKPSNHGTVKWHVCQMNVPGARR